MKVLYYRGTHNYSFKSGEWARVIGTAFKNRMCFVVEYQDGTIDYTPIIDNKNYELKEINEY